MTKSRFYLPLIFCLTSALFAEAHVSATQPTLRVWPSTQPDEPEISRTVLPKIHFAQVSLTDAIDYLRTAVPGLQAVVISEPGTPADYPMIEKIDVDNVTVGQFMDMLTAAYSSVTISRVEDGPSTLYVVRIYNPGGTQESNLSPAPITIFRLTPIINDLLKPSAEPVDPAQAREDALEKILSLVQAALDGVPGGKSANIKVHQATETLLFSGSPAALQTVQAALGALKITDAERLQTQDNYNHYLDRSEKMRKDLQDQVLRLQQQLDAAKATGPTTKE